MLSHILKKSFKRIIIIYYLSSLIEIKCLFSFGKMHRNCSHYITLILYWLENSQRLKKDPSLPVGMMDI